MVSCTCMHQSSLLYKSDIHFENCEHVHVLKMCLDAWVFEQYNAAESCKQNWLQEAILIIGKKMKFHNKLIHSITVSPLYVYNF